MAELMLLQLSGLVFIFFLLFIVLLSLTATVLSIYAVFWTYKDAKRRGEEDPEVWALIVLFGSLPDLIVYLVTRE